jgi:uncharacterized protein (TIGR00255 family)
MNSMTGYGAGTAPLPPARPGVPAREIFVEASSVNRRGLELAVALPREWNALEAPLAELARERFHRGAVRVAMVLREPATAGAVVAAWDETAVAAALAQLRNLAERVGVPFSADTALLLRLAQDSRPDAAIPPSPDAWPAVRAAAAAAFEQLAVARHREGEALRRDLAARLSTLARLREEIAPLASETVTRYRETLHLRLRQIGLELDLNDERVLREIALFADRADIAEELTRLASHLDQFEKILGEEGAVGRKLDFLCQEIFREINTVGSKAQHLEITRRVLEAKNELERAREQVQNIE